MESIGIFDSGVGGFSILKSIKKLIKHQRIYYVADQKYVPYSQKPVDLIIKRAEKITQFLISKNCSTIVIACNTATVFTISHLRKKFKNINFVGVEPAIKPASKSKTGDILVLATKNTIKSNRLEKLVETHAKTRQIFYQDMPKWVIWAEAGIISGSQVDEYTCKKLNKYKHQPISTIVLACTHYPFFIESLKKVFKQAVIIDPSNAVAKQTKKLHPKTINNKSETYLFSTKHSYKFNRISHLLPFKVKIGYIHI